MAAIPCSAFGELPREEGIFCNLGISPCAMSSFSGLQHTLRSSQGPLRLRLGDGRRSRWALEHPSCSHTHQARGWLRHQRVQHPWATPPRCMPLRKALPALPCLPATDEDLQFVYLKKGEKKKKKRDCRRRYPPQCRSEGFARQHSPAPTQCIFSPGPGVTRTLHPTEETGVSHPKAPAFASPGKRE